MYNNRIINIELSQSGYYTTYICMQSDMNCQFRIMKLWTNFVPRWRRQIHEAALLKTAWLLLSRKLVSFITKLMPVHVVGCHCFSNYPAEAEHRALGRSSITSSLVSRNYPIIRLRICFLFFFKFILFFLFTLLRLSTFQFSDRIFDYYFSLKLAPDYMRTHDSRFVDYYIQEKSECIIKNEYI